MAEDLATRLRRLPAARWSDAALAAAIATACLVELLVRAGMSTSAFAPLAVIALCLPIAVRTRWPIGGVCAEAALIAVTANLKGDFPTTLIAAAAVIAYSCGAHAESRRAVLAVGVLLLLVFEITIGIPGGDPVPFALAMVSSLWIGRQVGSKRRAVDALAQRTRELEAEQDAFARLAVRRERARIARELHDITGHHLAVMVIQAGAGRFATVASPKQAAQQFRAIRDAGRQALAEMARLVDVLQADDARSSDGSERLQLLLDQVRTAGLRLHVTALPADLRLPAPVDEDVYRIIQEGLTNAMKHAPGAEVHVCLAADDAIVHIEVRDWGSMAARTLSETGSRLGLTGMREHVEAIGGSLDAGPHPEGGWCLQARLPVPAPPAVLPR
jgi:signal transduction histidine kinase